MPKILDFILAWQKSDRLPQAWQITTDNPQEKTLLALLLFMGLLYYFKYLKSCQPLQ